MQVWPHAPVHRLSETGAFIVTASTYLKAPLFAHPDKLDILQDAILRVAAELDWKLQAWAVLANHYHFVAMSPSNAGSLRELIKRVHGSTAVLVNRLDAAQGRKVWHEYWDTHITYERSYLARLNYVNENPVKHRLVRASHQYKWCSAAWFQRTADPAFYKTVSSFPTDKVNVIDNFDMECGD